LLGLEGVLSLGLCGPTHDKLSWTFDLDPGGVDPVLGIPRLHDAYLARFPNYPHGITVPAVIDVPTRQVVTNDYAQITLDSPPSGPSSTGRRRRSCIPKRCARRSTRRTSRCSATSTNGVYRVVSPGHRNLRGRLRSALRPTGPALGTACGATLSGRRHDHRGRVRLFTTLARFDPVYHGHFKCNRSKLSEMPVLWAYARDLYQTLVSATPPTSHRSRSTYYVVHRDINPTGIVRRDRS